MQAIPSVIIALFAGSWSDLHGRKALIVSSIFGYLISNAVFMINAHFFYELKAEYLLFEVSEPLFFYFIFKTVSFSVSSRLHWRIHRFVFRFNSGSESSDMMLIYNFIVFFMACNAYLADVTDPSDRTRRVAFMTGLLYPGFNLGKALSLPIKENLGFMGNFGFGMLVTVITALYVIICVPDSIPIREKRLKKQAAEIDRPTDIDFALEGHDSTQAENAANSSKREKLKRLFSLKNVKDGVR